MKVKLCPGCRYTCDDLAERYDASASEYLCFHCPADVPVAETKAGPLAYQRTALWRVCKAELATDERIGTAARGV